MEAPFSTIDDGLRAAGRRLVNRHPRWESLLLRARDRYARSYVRARWLVNRLRYAAPPRPYRLVEVDPSDIQRLAPLPGPKFKHAGAVVGGDWDRSDERFEEQDVFRAYRRHFDKGVPWNETAFYDRVVTEIEAGRTLWDCRTQQEFDDRCEKLDQLYESIRADGYRTQAELRDPTATDPISPETGASPLKTERFKHEIAVSFGRDGDPLFADGRNRLSIVKLLGVERVPVRVLRRHSRWQGVRDAAVRGRPVPPAFRDHPDILSLASGE